MLFAVCIVDMTPIPLYSSVFFCILLSSSVLFCLLVSSFAFFFLLISLSSSAVFCILLSSSVFSCLFLSSSVFFCSIMYSSAVFLLLSFLVFCRLPSSVCIILSSVVCVCCCCGLRGSPRLLSLVEPMVLLRRPRASALLRTPACVPLFKVCRVVCVRCRLAQRARAHLCAV